MASKLLGKFAYEQFLNACESNLVTESKLLEICKQICEVKVYGKLVRHIIDNKYDGRATARYMLDDVWFQLQEGGATHPDLVMSVERLQTMLRSPEVQLNNLAYELVDRRTIPGPINGKEPRIVLLGRTGDGKSTFANILLDTDQFAASDGCESVTQNINVCKSFLNNHKDKPLTVIDTPGMDDSQHRDSQHLNSIVKYLQKIREISAMVLVIESTSKRFTASMKDMLRIFELSFGSEFWAHLVIKVQNSKDSGKWIRKLKEEFPASKDVNIESKIFQLDRQANFTHHDNDQELLKFYEIVDSMGTFDCSSVDYVKSERDELKQKLEQYKKLLQQLTGSKYSVGLNSLTPDTDVSDSMQMKYTIPITKLTAEDKELFLEIVSTGVGEAAPGMGQTLAYKLGAGDFYKQRRLHDEIRGLPRQHTVRTFLEQKWLVEKGNAATIQSMIHVLQKNQLQSVVEKIKNAL